MQTRIVAVQSEPDSQPTLKLFTIGTHRSDSPEVFLSAAARLSTYSAPKTSLNIASCSVVRMSGWRWNSPRAFTISWAPLAVSNSSTVSVAIRHSRSISEDQTGEQCEGMAAFQAYPPRHGSALASINALLDQAIRRSP